MFTIGNRRCSRLQTFLNSLINLERQCGFLSSIFLTRTRGEWPVGRLSFTQRMFKTLSCIHKEKGQDFCSNGKRKEKVICDINKKHESSNVSNAASAVSLTQEFLGIEVFPEIFDELPPKCSGCGAILQSSFVDKPGFIPENKNPMLSHNEEENQFKSEIICSRCFNIKHYNKDILPVLAPNVINNYLRHIARRKALILYSIDVTDIPCSFVPNILNIIGETKYLILICNKVDRLPVDGNPQRQMEHIKTLITEESRKHGLSNANIVDICIISAKTGFGVERLVKIITGNWRKNSDIYIVGSNNSGKTTLFNLLVDLFSASRHTESMLQRGTTSNAPGTTLSLLTYPVTYHRFLRLQDRLRQGYSEEKSKENSREVHLDNNIIDQELTKYAKVVSHETNQSNETSEVITFRPELVEKNNDDNVGWLYDTPGIYNENQISHFLTNKELQILNPSLWFVPRTLILKPGKVLFVGGLARLDYINIQRVSRTVHGDMEDVPKASQSVFFTVFASPNLPLHVTSVEKADAFYEEHAGGNLLKVPSGDKERMEMFPSLSGRVMEVTGVDWKQSAADVVFSSVGWITVTAGRGSVVSIKAYTPNGTGNFLRDPPLLPTCVRQRGRRGVPYLGHVNYAMYQATRKNSPSLLNTLTKEKDSGITQWMRVAEKKRKRQRALLKFEKMKWHSLKRIGFSAKSNPMRYLEDYEGLEEVDENVASAQKELES